MSSAGETNRCGSLALGPNARVLLACLDNVGDLVFTTALLRTIRSAFPRAEIVVWCKRYASDIVPFMRGVDRVIASDPFWDTSPGQGKGSLSSFLKAWREITRGAFDLAVVTSRHWRVAAAVALAGIPSRIGYHRRHTRFWLTHQVPDADREKPVVSELARLLEPLGLADQVGRYEMALPERFAGVSAPWGRGRVVALHPFAGRKDRCVSLETWRAVAMTLDTAGLRPLWVGSRNELTEFRAEGGAPSSSLYGDEVGGATLADLARLLSRTALFLGHDSGPLHIASALGVPALGIFAPGQPRRTFPQGTGPWRMIATESPCEVTTERIVATALELHPGSA